MNFEESEDSASRWLAAYVEELTSVIGRWPTRARPLNYCAGLFG